MLKKQPKLHNKSYSIFKIHKMKRTLLIPVIILFLFSSHLFSQDIITLKTGDKIEAKVTEENEKRRANL